MKTKTTKGKSRLKFKHKSISEVAKDLVNDHYSVPKLKDLTITQELIVEECDAVKDLLIQKNRDYGDSALQPNGVFSDADPVEGIRLRIDDKLKRIKNMRDRSMHDTTEDTVQDLIGYLILLRVAERQLGLNKPMDEWVDSFLARRKAQRGE